VVVQKEVGQAERGEPLSARPSVCSGGVVGEERIEAWEMA